MNFHRSVVSIVSLVQLEMCCGLLGAEFARFLLGRSRYVRVVMCMLCVSLYLTEDEKKVEHIDRILKIR